MPSSPFPHLNLLFKTQGAAKLEGGGGPDPNVVQNQSNRVGHSSFLKSKVGGFSYLAKQLIEARTAAGLPTIEGGVPFVLRIPNEDDGTLEFLAEKLGIEIVAEYADGFLIVATEDLDLQRLVDLANDFATSVRGSGGMASIIDIDEDPHSVNRITRILDEQLLQKWPFPDDVIFVLDVSIEVAPFGLPAKPRMSTRTKPEVKDEKLADHAAAMSHYHEQWDEKRMTREGEIEKFVNHYGGEILSITDDSHIVEFSDSFSARIRMSGKGFKDLLQNYPSLFEALLPDHIASSDNAAGANQELDSQFVLVPPFPGSPALCVIDSGIQENHRWLAAAIDTKVSRCFIPGKLPTDVADYVSDGGHGTRVAGACLYPISVPVEGTMIAPFFLQNARVLDEQNGLLTRVFPAELLRNVVDHFFDASETRIYQHSIASDVGFRVSRMSVWAAAIDLLSYKRDVLFIQAAGNIRAVGTPTNPGILDHIRRGRNYPAYMLEPSSRIANPAQSLQALTVGSIASCFYQESDRCSFAREHQPSAFSRIGFGMWDSIKPEVVEIGGDFVRDGGIPPQLTTPQDVCPELVRSTLHGGPAFARNAVGTSFAAPKVAHIAGHLAALFPTQSTLVYRALIVNSARWPIWAEQEAIEKRPAIIRAIGYGVPDLSRATENSEHRVTLITESPQFIKAAEGFIFGVPIPEQLRRQGDDSRIRIDVTLSYAAEPRRTRKSRRGYLGVWLDWKASKKRESFAAFHGRALKDMGAAQGADDGNFQWTLGNAKERNGESDGVSRRNGTVQKDWAIVNSYDLPDVFGVIVRGHKGWDRLNLEATARFALVVSFEIIGADLPIYETIKSPIEVELRTSEARVGLNQ